MLILLLVLVIGIIVMANLLTRQANAQALYLFGVTLLFLHGALLLIGVGLLTAVVAVEPALLPNPEGVGAVVLLLGVWGVLVGQTAVRRFLARWTAVDPTSTVHLLALLLAGYLVGGTAVSLVQGGLAGLAETAVAVSVTDVVLQQTLFALVALFGVGLLTRRANDALHERLGLVPLAAVSWKTAVRWIVLLIITQAVIGGIGLWLNPEQAELLTDISGELFADFDTPWEWFALAVASGIGEELLFRGALQPIFGLWPTALLFAVSHVQYGLLTPATLAIFVVGLALGYVRQQTNTTTTMVIHFGYNFILGLLTLLAAALEPLAG